MWTKLFICILGISLSCGWVHDGKIIGINLIQNNILPVNYFYVQFFNVYGQNLTNLSERDQNLFQFTLRSNDCRRYTLDKIYTGHGLFIIRIKTYQECHNIEIGLKYRNRHVKDSPICIKTLYPENCKCPKSLNNFKVSMSCDNNEEQINEDLSHFNSINFTDMRQYVKRNFENSRSSSVCNYVIKSNKIYRKCYGQYVGFKMFIDALLISLTNKVQLPDIEFFFNLGDWPLMKLNGNEKFPIFSWCGSKNTLDIVVPTYELTESTINMMYRTTIDIFSVQREKWKWDEKIQKGFFKGRDSRRERLELVSLARKHPDLLNCSITNFFFFKDEITSYGPKTEHISFTNFFQYKYQINIDGTVAAYRFPYLLASDSVVLKQDSNYYEHFYRKLKPYKHYVPFDHDPNINLIDKLLWLKHNDEKAKKMSRNSRQFVHENLSPRNIYCYYATLFEKFSEKIISKVEILKDMEKVEDNSIECSCKDIF